MKLLVEPLVESEGEDAVDVAGVGAEGKAVEELDGAFAIGQRREGVGSGGGRGSLWLEVRGVARDLSGSG
jgi:hypothetical protein